MKTFKSTLVFLFSLILFAQYADMKHMKSKLQLHLRSRQDEAPVEEPIVEEVQSEEPIVEEAQPEEVQAEEAQPEEVQAEEAQPEEVQPEVAQP
jgi:hypothetical protein